METARRRYRADLGQQRLLVAPSVNDGHFQTARKLLVRYGAAEGLRTLGGNSAKLKPDAPAPPKEA